MMSLEYYKLSMYQPSNGLSKEAWFTAVRAGNNPLVRQYIDNGFDVNSCDDIGNTALHLAAVANHTTTIYILYASGADLTLKNNANQSPLTYARLYGASLYTLNYIAGLLLGPEACGRITPVLR